jgi:hypothetical protein
MRRQDQSHCLLYVDGRWIGANCFQRTSARPKGASQPNFPDLLLRARGRLSRRSDRPPKSERVSGLGLAGLFESSFETNRKGESPMPDNIDTIIELRSSGMLRGRLSSAFRQRGLANAQKAGLSEKCAPDGSQAGRICNVFPDVSRINFRAVSPYQAVRVRKLRFRECSFAFLPVRAAALGGAGGSAPAY